MVPLPTEHARRSWTSSTILYRKYKELEELGKLEAHHNHNHQNKHQANCNQHRLAASRLPYDNTQFLLSCFESAVGDVHVLVQLIKQSLLQPQLVIDRQSDMLQVNDNVSVGPCTLRQVQPNPRSRSSVPSEIASSEIRSRAP